MTDTLRQNPSAMSSAGLTHSLCKLVHYESQFIVRGQVGDPRFQAAVQAVAGLALPTRVNTAEKNDQAALYCLGPDEWLFQSKNALPDFELNLRLALADLHHSIVDVSSAFVSLGIEHPTAHEWLMRGCPQDLHPRVFTTGQATQSHLAKANVILYCLKAGSHFEITVRTSFAQYLQDWLAATI